MNKVLFVTSAPSPHLVPLLEALGEELAGRLEVWYLAPRFEDRNWGAERGRVRSRMVGGSGWADLQTVPAAVCVLDISYWKPRTHKLVVRLRQQGVPLVFFGEAPSPLSPLPVRVFRRLLVRRYLRQFVGLIGVTEETVQTYRREYGFQGATLRCPYHREVPSLAAARGHRRRTSEIRFLVLASLIRRKGVDIVLAATAGLRGEWKLSLAGDGPLREELEKLVPAERRERVIFLGEVAYEEVPSLLASHDVMLVPSRWDGFGMATIEGLAAGMPVIATDQVMSALEYVRQGVDGWIVPVADPEALAVAMQRLVDDRECLERQAISAARQLTVAYRLEEDARRLASFLLACGEQGGR